MCPDTLLVHCAVVVLNCPISASLAFAALSGANEVETTLGSGGRDDERPRHSLLLLPLFKSSSSSVIVLLYGYLLDKRP